MSESYSAGGVVINSDGLVLVTNQHNDSWSLPKGQIDPGETAPEAAKREIEEESGINQLEYVKKLGSYQRYRIGKGGIGETDHHKTITMFLYRTNQTELGPSDPENPEARWVEPDHVADLLTHPKDKEFFRQALPGIRKII